MYSSHYYLLFQFKPSCLTCPPSLIYCLKWLLCTCFPNFCHFPTLNSKATCYIWNSQALYSLTLDLAIPSTVHAQGMVFLSLRQQLPNCGLISSAIRGLMTIFKLLETNTLTIDLAYLDPGTQQVNSTYLLNRCVGDLCGEK